MPGMNISRGRKTQSAGKLRSQVADDVAKQIACHDHVELDESLLAQVYESPEITGPAMGPAVGPMSATSWPRASNAATSA